MDNETYTLLKDIVAERLAEIKDIKTRHEALKIDRQQKSEEFKTLDAQLKENGNFLGEENALSEVFSQEYEDAYVSEPQDLTDDEIRRSIIDFYSKESDNILDKYERSEEYMDIDAVQSQIKVVENIIRIFEARGKDIDVENQEENRDILNSAPFKGFINKVKTELKKLQEAEAIIAERRENRELQDQVIINNEKESSYYSIGVDIDASKNSDGIVLNGINTEVFNTLKDIIGEEMLMDLLMQAKAFTKGEEQIPDQFPLIFAEGLIQIIRNNPEHAEALSKILKVKQEKLIEAISQIEIINNIFENKVANSKERYLTNPERYVEDLLQESKRGDSNVAKAIKEYSQTKDLLKLISDLERIDPASELVQFIKLHKAFVSAHNLRHNLSTTSNVIDRTDDENAFIKEILTKLKSDPQLTSAIPNNQQLLAIRELIKWFASPLDNSNLYQGQLILEDMLVQVKQKL